MRAAALAVVLVAVLPGSAAARSHGCDIPRSRVVAKNARVVVVRHADDFFACLRATGVRRRLDTNLAQTVMGHIRLAGRFVAYEREDECWDGCFRMVSLDVRSGRRLVSYAAYNRERKRQLQSIALDSRGRLAWIRDDAERELHRMDGDGEDVIDAGPGIEPASLAIRAAQVVWQHDGETRTAPLDSHPPCAARNTTTLERTPEVRIFWKALPSKYDDTFGAVHGCDVATGRVTRMGERGLDTFEYYGGGFVEAAGHFATIDEGYSGRGDSRADLSVFDLTTGRRVHRWAPRDGNFSVLAVVLHPSGAVAWMYSGAYYGSSRGTSAVAKSDASGEAVVLASTDKFVLSDRETLQLDGSTVSWTLNGTPGSADLAP